MTQLQDVISALRAEADDVDRLLVDLDEAGWDRQTPAPDWTIAHQIAHLTATFRMAADAAADQAAFRRTTSTMGDDFDAAVSKALAPYLALPRGELFCRWQAQRDAATAALAAVPPGQTVPWLVNPLPAEVLASAGMMELFGHGQDIADTLGVHREHTDRIRPLVVFGARTRDFGYLARGLTPPSEQFRFDLTAPSGALWTVGDADAAQVISGPAVDFCLLVSRRRHRDDLSLVAQGAEAEQWLDIAQAYRGPAGEGRRPGQFATTRH
ncbi:MULTISPECIES: TIGR03084 family metal-binding protein [Actinoalloteichus]|uniref:TIGR03084 family protein n=1 Tax=Actinoalloteichus fjordicus TaxID=1612552 RepID=A0AAC9PTC5_9PSEU|nr:MULTISPECIES: TIGR03084 family metal-binding protein [Actinoalloteichus]APU15741.1 putative TIGR03084 family protein [Actinoalloteichus fjordicus]APU21801.1 putative TIGR03084 family protein [Actinoalloteichus sp. GBA129-24]